jgi:hypothetical protein
VTCARFLGLCPDVPPQRERASRVLRALCTQHGAPDASRSSTASLPLFGFDPDAQTDPAVIDFAVKGLWAQDAKGAFSLRRHIQAIHSRANSLAPMDVSQEPALALHPFKFKSWQEALSGPDGPSLHQQPASRVVDPEDDSPLLPALQGTEPSLLPHVHTFVFKCWPRMCDCESSMVDLRRGAT